MIIAMIHGCTRILGKSQGYLGLPVRDGTLDCPVNGPGTHSMTTAWEPTAEELDRLTKGAKVEVRILGMAHPPIMVEVGEVPEDADILENKGGIGDGSKTPGHDG